ncbi:TMhelix containing protein [Vibrio phage 1.081.O._10N.286.52.C2]|nr:TMhelix containing protein [Vibrio phage 1.081.O._10N.286.52.C2]
MEFVLALAPIFGIAAFALLALLVIFIVAKLAKQKLAFPYARVIMGILIATVLLGAVKIATSPLTRPSVTPITNDTAAYKVDQFTEIEVPVLTDKTRKTDEDLLTGVDSEATKIIDKSLAEKFKD